MAYWHCKEYLAVDFSAALSLDHAWRPGPLSQIGQLFWANKRILITLHIASDR